MCYRGGTKVIYERKYHVREHKIPETDTERERERERQTDGQTAAVLSLSDHSLTPTLQYIVHVLLLFSFLSYQ